MIFRCAECFTEYSKDELDTAPEPNCNAKACPNCEAVHWVVIEE